jgi:2,3-bisphosphoglycerate-independent phosphoglycerate mutase
VDNQTLSQVLSEHRLKQAKITDPEKAIHPQYSLKGKREHPFPQQFRIIVPSPRAMDLILPIPRP